MIHFPQFNDVNAILLKLEPLISPAAVKALLEQLSRVVVIEIKEKSLNDIYIHDNLKKYLNFTSNAHIMENYLGLNIDIFPTSTEIPIILLINNSLAVASSIALNMQMHARAEYIQLDNALSESINYQFNLAQYAQLTKLWFNNSTLQNNTAVSINRSICLEEGAKFYDIQIFSSNIDINLNSHIKYNGLAASSDSNNIILSKGGNFSYEPVQEHCASYTTSNLICHMILEQNAKASFKGLIKANKDIQHCEAKQENKNILLSPQCSVNAQPSLEIMPKHISCKHGSATGEIDSRQIYYLQTRGFDLIEAKKLLVKSFAQSIIHLTGEENFIQNIALDIINDVI